MAAPTKSFTSDIVEQLDEMMDMIVDLYINDKDGYESLWDSYKQQYIDNGKAEHLYKGFRILYERKIKVKADTRFEREETVNIVVNDANECPKFEVSTPSTPSSSPGTLKHGCIHIVMRGERKGQHCGRPSTKDTDYCSAHKIRYINDSPGKVVNSDNTPSTIPREENEDIYSSDCYHPLLRHYAKPFGKDGPEYEKIANSAAENIAFITNNGRPHYVCRNEEGNWYILSQSNFIGTYKDRYVNFITQDAKGNEKVTKTGILKLIDEHIPRYKKADNYCGNVPEGHFDMMSLPETTFMGSTISRGPLTIDFHPEVDKGILDEDDDGNIIWDNQKALDYLSDKLKYILNHICQVLAGDNVKHYHYIMAFFADMLLEPGNKKAICLLIRGTQGCGKSIIFEWFIKVVLLPHNGVVVSDPSQIGIGGNFNGLLEGRMLCVLDDIDRKSGLMAHPEPVKTLISGDTININAKNRPTYSTRNILRFVGLTNHDEIVKLDSDDRRFVAFEASDVYLKNREYFDMLRKVLYGDMSKSADEIIQYQQYIGMLFTTFLMKCGVADNVNLRNIPDTKWRTHLMGASLPSHIQFLKDIVNGDEILQKPIKDDDITYYTLDELHSIYRSWIDATKSFSSVNRNQFVTSISQCLSISVKQITMLIDGKQMRPRCLGLSRSLIADKLKIDITSYDDSNDIIENIQASDNNEVHANHELLNL